jgi:hypothetical protein
VGDEANLGGYVRSIESGSRGLLGLMLFCQDDCRLERGTCAFSDDQMLRIHVRAIKIVGSRCTL